MSRRPSPMSPKDRTQWCWYGVTAAVPSACFTQAAAPSILSPTNTKGTEQFRALPLLDTRRVGSQIGPPPAFKLAYHASDEIGGRYGSLHEVRRRITRHSAVLPELRPAASSAPARHRVSARHAAVSASHGGPFGERCRHRELRARLADRHHLLFDRQPPLCALPRRPIHRYLWGAAHHPHRTGHDVR